ncbi:dolichyl glycosyltransferase, putative [Ricinus communis]|uniref:Alpha-1,3-glucosyltransferase n=1 Tax=Ricinus communis TaxID=3988 RepID=B9S6A4_RICCO|nr:dolichyl glycosyltransferase, putative [Ricinus communis]
MECQTLQMHARSAIIQQLFWFFSLAACIKLVLIPSYHSTDFEVHRHWLALTHSLPLSQWYFDETSPWTLDYPPFFAYYEYILSLFAQFIDPQMVDIYRGLNYKSNTVIYFQRISVIISDLCLLYGIYRLTKNLESRKRILMWVLVVWSPGLIMVDHMHFQYNVAAPVYFVYLLRHYCWKGISMGFRRFSAMGAVVVVVFAVAYGPFLYYGQIQQVVRRMFPFGRGLCHAYWAPNFWVFYMVLDKCLAIVLRKLRFNIQAPTASFTGGLVGDSSPFAVLPQITPLTTFIMVLLALSPCLLKAWKNPQPRLVARWIAYAYTCGFVFGWHVHEKASLHFVIPLAIVATHSLEDARHYFLLAIGSCYSLFPLLYEAQEYPIKVLLLLLHSILMWYCFSAQFTKDAAAKENAPAKRGGEQFGSQGTSSSTVEGGIHIGRIGKCYLVGLLAVETWGQLLHPYLLGDKLPFLPLILISTFCALEIMYSWIWQLRWILKST